MKVLVDIAITFLICVLESTNFVSRADRNCFGYALFLEQTAGTPGLHKRSHYIPLASHFVVTDDHTFTNNSKRHFLRISCSVWGRTAQPVQRIATDWTVRGSNPGRGDIFCSRSGRPWGPPSLLYNGYRVFFLGVKGPWRSVDHPHQSSADVKEREELHLCSLLGLRDLFQGEHYLYLCCCVVQRSENQNFRGDRYGHIIRTAGLSTFLYGGLANKIHV